ncbi:hypothetical protein K439DRAFT_1158620 [Ramaria rubella]|nr:hypothetical protein K439DRAFT_1158620 [Ramaria rubella]
MPLLSLCMRGSQGSNLIKVVPISYRFDNVDPRLYPLVARGLLEDGNLVYPMVYSNKHDAVRRSEWDRQTILRPSADCVSHLESFQSCPSTFNCPCVYSGSFFTRPLCSQG